jgi:hypothetical protein
MPRRIREDHPNYELRGAEVRKARLRRPCDSIVCARNKVWIEEGQDYAYVSTGLAFCDYTHWGPEDVVEVSR